MEHLRRLGTVVYLSLSLPQVEARIHNLDSRGIALQPGQTLAQVYAARQPLYERYAHVTVTVDGQSLSETVQAVRRALGR
jgi:shikimate kinase